MFAVTNVVYDAEAVGRILGLPVECRDPAPPAEGSEMIVYYGGWDLTALRAARTKLNFVLWHGWSGQFKWEAEPGYYRLLLPVAPAATDEMSWDDRLRFLQTEHAFWQIAPASVAVTALVTHIAATGINPLSVDHIRCKPMASGKTLILHFARDVFAFQPRPSLSSDEGIPLIAARKADA